VNPQSKASPPAFEYETGKSVPKVWIFLPQLFKSRRGGTAPQVIPKDAALISQRLGVLAQKRLHVGTVLDFRESERNALASGSEPHHHELALLDRGTRIRRINDLVPLKILISNPQ